MTKIKILDSHLTNMIAAGEVVERPSGIVKELVENALDAHADQITVRIEAGGMDLIEVSDNGEGMSAEDLSQAFERHSTSKIHHAKDLNRITSFGFRGEALPSIASVSHVEATTHNGEAGYTITVNNGVKSDTERFARNPGTTITVHELFLKTPARLKYIKNINYEASIVLDIIQKFAMSRPDVAFTYYNGDKLSFRSYGNNKLQDVFHHVHGAPVAQDSRLFNQENYDFSIDGIMALPQHNRAHRHAIWIYVNGRMVRYPKAQNAVVEAYRRHMPAGRYPLVVLNIHVDPQLVDVNVHPSKWEIRMSKEDQLIVLIDDSFMRILHEKMEAPRVQLASAKTIEEPLQFDLKTLYETPQKPETEKPVTESAAIGEELEEDSKAHEFFEATHEAVDEVNVDSEQNDGSHEAIEALQILSQFSGKYILAQGEQGLYIIDQHAAMERVRYEYFQEKLLNRHNEQQALLIPYVFTGRSKAVGRIEEINDAFSVFQIRLEGLDDETLVLRDVPVWIKTDEIQEFIENVLDFFEAERNIREEDFRRRALATLACHSSVRFNEFLSQQAMEALVSSLRACKQPFHCPHGRPTFIVVDHQQLIREFKR